jgi:hypothetical protein
MQNLFGSTLMEKKLFMVQHFFVRTIQRSGLVYRTSLVRHLWKGNIVWFSIIAQNHFGSALVEREHCMVQHYWTEPIWFCILSIELFMVQHYRLEPLMVSYYRTELSIGSADSAEPKKVLESSIFFSE